MKLFGGFHGDRSKTLKKTVHPAETENRDLRAAEASGKPEAKLRSSGAAAPAEAPAETKLTPEAHPAEAAQPPKTEKPAETKVLPKLEEPGEPEKLPEKDLSDTKVIPAKEDLSDTKVIPTKEDISDTKVLPEKKDLSETKVVPELGDLAGKEGPSGSSGEEAELGETTKQIVFRTPEEEAEIEEIIAAYQKKKRRRRIIVLAILAVLVIGGVVIWKSLVKPPEIVQPTVKPTAEPSAQPTATAKPADPAVTPTEAPPEETPIPERMRRENVYTFMMVGRDQGGGNTDAIMVGVFDVAAGTVNVVSIPRDTCANVDSDPHNGETKKISGVYARADYEGLRDAVSDMLGFPIDCYVSVGINGFIQLVQTIGGVTFNVPHYMDYDDPTQDLHIHFSAGEQYINGYDAIKIVRWRQNNDGTNYGDIDRIQTQQEFLKTVFKKCISMDQLVSNLDDYIKIFQEYVKTDLTTGNMTWFAKEFLKLSMENIHFHTLPSNYNDMIGGFSYGTVLVDEWMEMLNEHLNPYDQPITLEDVDLIYRDEDGNLCATSGEIRGGMESFLTMEEYLRQLREYNDWLERQRQKEEERAGNSGAGSGESSGETNGGE